MTPTERSALAAVARAAAEDVAAYRTPGGMVTYDDMRVWRMLAREPEFARLVPIALAAVDQLAADLATIARASEHLVAEGNRHAARIGELEHALDEVCELVEELTKGGAPAPPATMRARDLRALVGGGS